MRKTYSALAILSLLAAPQALQAQRGPERQANPGVTQILNARRALDLTPRQVAQLDSIERSIYAARRATEMRARALGDSIRTQARTRAEQNDGRLTEAQRDSVRQRMQTMRPQMERLRAQDSTARAAALRVLNDAQRQQLREIQAEERGRRRGMMEARRQGPGAGARPGMRRPPMDREREMRQRMERERMERRRPDARPEGDAPTA